MADILPVCFIVDENVYQYLEIISKSLLKHVSIPVHFCILTNKKENIDKISTLFDAFSKNYTIKLLSIEHMELLRTFYMPEGRKDIANFGYAQLLFPFYFANFKKILFLEPDQIVRSDLAPFWREMWEKDMKLCAAGKLTGPTYTIKTLRQLYPTIKTKCYNAGVMLVDTEYWNTHNYLQLCLDALQKQKDTNGAYYDYYAEGAINVALQPYIVEIDAIYNTRGLGNCETITKDILEKAVILHWNGDRKPWLANGLYKSYYLL